MFVRHGTRCAGEVAAQANNGICSAGVAYDAGIGGESCALHCISPKHLIALTLENSNQFAQFFDCCDRNPFRKTFYIIFRLVVATLWNSAGHYISILSLLFFYLSFFSSPHLSGRRLDVYHTSTHGAALVRI